MNLGALTGAFSTALSAVSTQIQEYFTDTTKRYRHFIFPTLAFVLGSLGLVMAIVGPDQIYSWFTGLALSVQALVGALLTLLFILLVEASRHLTLMVRRLYSGEWLPEWLSRRLRMNRLEESHGRVTERGIFQQAKKHLDSASDILEGLGEPPDETTVPQKKEYPVLRHPLGAYHFVTGKDWCWKEMEEVKTGDVTTTPQDLVAHYTLAPLPAGEPIAADKLKSSPGTKFHETGREILTLNVHPTETGPWLNAGLVVDLRLTARGSNRKKEIEPFEGLLVLDHQDDEQVVLSVDGDQVKSLLGLLPDCDVTFTRRPRSFQSSGDEDQPSAQEKDQVEPLVAVPVVKGKSLKPGQLIQREHIHWREPRPGDDLPSEGLRESDLVGKVYWPRQIDSDPVGPVPGLEEKAQFKKDDLLKDDDQPRTPNPSWLTYQEGGKVKYRQAYRVFEDNKRSSEYVDWYDESIPSKKGRALDPIRDGDRVMVKAYGKDLAGWCYVYKKQSPGDVIHYFIAVKEGFEDGYNGAKKEWRRKRAPDASTQNGRDELLLLPFHSVPVLKEEIKPRQLIAQNQIDSPSYYAGSDEITDVCLSKEHVVDHYVVSPAGPQPHRPIPLKSLASAIPSGQARLSLEAEEDLADRVTVEDAGRLKKGDLVSIELTSPYGDSPAFWTAACVRDVGRSRGRYRRLTRIELAIPKAYQQAQERWDEGDKARLTVTEQGWGRLTLEEKDKQNLLSTRVRLGGRGILTPGTLVSVNLTSKPSGRSTSIWLDACVREVKPQPSRGRQSEIIKLELAVPQSEEAQEIQTLWGEGAEEEAQEAQRLWDEGAETVISIMHPWVEWIPPVREDRIEMVGVSLDDLWRWNYDVPGLIQLEMSEPTGLCEFWSPRIRLEYGPEDQRRLKLTMPKDERFQEIKETPQSDKGKVVVTMKYLLPNLGLEEEWEPTFEEERVRIVGGVSKAPSDLNPGTPVLIRLNSQKEVKEVKAYSVGEYYPTDYDQPGGHLRFFVPQSEHARDAQSLWGGGANAEIMVMRKADSGWDGILILEPAQGQKSLPRDQVRIEDDLSNEVSDLQLFTLVFIGLGKDAAKGFKAYVLRAERTPDHQSWARLELFVPQSEDLKQAQELWHESRMARITDHWIDAPFWTALALEPRNRGERISERVKVIDSRALEKGDLVSVSLAKPGKKPELALDAYVRGDVGGDPKSEALTELRLGCREHSDTPTAQTLWNKGAYATITVKSKNDQTWTGLTLKPRNGENFSDRVTVGDSRTLEEGNRTLEEGDLVSVSLAETGGKPELALDAYIREVGRDPQSEALTGLKLDLRGQDGDTSNAQALWDNGYHAEITVKSKDSLILKPEPNLDLARRLVPRLEKGSLVSLALEETTKNDRVHWKKARVTQVSYHDAGELTEVRLVNLAKMPCWRRWSSRCSAQRLWKKGTTRAIIEFVLPSDRIVARNGNESRANLVLRPSPGESLSSRMTFVQRGDLVEMVFEGPGKEKKTFVWEKAYVGCAQQGDVSAALTKLELAVPEREVLLAQKLWKEGATATVTVTHTDAKVQQTQGKLKEEIAKFVNYLKQLNKVISAGDLPEDGLLDPAEQSEILAKKLGDLHGQMADRPWQGDEPPEGYSREEAERELWALIGQLRSTVAIWTDALQRVQKNRQRDTQLALPDSLADTRPTRLGNVLAAAADYPRTAYGIDTTTMLPRLLQVLEEEDKTLIRLCNAEASMNMLLLFSFWSAVWTGLGTLAILATVYIGWREWWVTPLIFTAGLTISWLTKEAATSQAYAYGEALKSLFDLRRRKMFAAVGLPDLETKEMTPAEERRHWEYLYSLFALGDAKAEDFPALKAGGGVEGE